MVARVVRMAMPVTMAVRVRCVTVVTVRMAVAAVGVTHREAATATSCAAGGCLRRQDIAGR